MLSPLQLQFAIAFYTSSYPEELITSPFYDSPPGQEAKKWLLENGLIRDGDDGPWGDATDRLRVFVEHLCSQPLPVQAWAMPTQDRSE